jgi:hypothetical protein
MKADSENNYGDNNFKAAIKRPLAIHHCLEFSVFILLLSTNMTLPL